MRLVYPLVALGCALALVQPAFAEKGKDLESEDKLQNFEIQDLSSDKKTTKGKPQIQDLTVTKPVDKSSPSLP